MNRSRLRLLALSSVVMLMATVVPAAAAAPLLPAAADSAIFFAADGMRQDLASDFAAEDPAAFANFDWLRDEGVDSGSGMISQSPPNTGAGWNSMATGSWVSETGTTNNTFHRNGTNFAAGTSALGSGQLLAESAAQAWEKAGKKVALVEWAGGRDAPINGPIVDFRRFLSGRGVTTNYLEEAPLDDAGFIAAFGLQFDSNLDHPGLSNTANSGQWLPDDQYAGTKTAAQLGWKNLPKSRLAPRATRMRVLDFGEDKYGLNVVFYSAAQGGKPAYDRVLFDTDKDPSNGIVADLAEGEWAEMKVAIQGGALAGRTGGFLFKVESLDTGPGNKPIYRLFHSSVTRANAVWTGWTGDDGYTNFEDFVADRFPVSTAADFAVLEAGIVSEDTYVEQGLFWETGHRPIIEYIGETYQPEIFMVGYPVTDEFQHQFLSLVTPTVPGPGGTGAPNPVYDDFDLDGNADGRIAARSAYIERAYLGADETLGLVRSVMDDNGLDPVVFAGADHGFAPQFLALQGGLPLFELGYQSAEQTSNCRPRSKFDVAKACWAGGALQVYLQLAGRDPDPRTQAERDASVPDPRLSTAQYAAARAAIVAKYQGLTDPDPTRSGWKVIDSVYLKEQTRYLDDGAGGTINMLHPTRTGDVVVFSYPPYQWDAATPGLQVAPSRFYGQHGYEPKLQDLENNINMRAAFMAAGPGIVNRAVADVRAIDLAPSLSYALGLPSPANAFGQIRTDIFEATDLRQVTLLNLSDFHGQIEPMSESVDGVSNRIGGLGFIDTIWDQTAAESIGATFRFMGGDSVGATPPISGFFQDAPTITAMNLAGIDADGIGNHNFDSGIARLETQVAAADFTYLTANVFLDGSDVRPAWAQPYLIRELDGVRVAFIGFTNTDVPELVNPTFVQTLDFREPAPIVSALAAQLRAAESVDVVVAFGHAGALTCTDSFGRACSGELIDLAGELSGVDVLAGDHTGRQVNLTTDDADGDPILVTENLSRGARYTEIKLVTGADGTLLYKTARWHRPWDIGVVPNGPITSLIAGLKTDLGPILNEQLGASTVEILRADPCGNAEGRTCESLEGNLVTDAQRVKYGVDFAFTNAGGLRANLTCQTGETLDANGQPCRDGSNRFIIRKGGALAMLPFGNVSVTLQINGAELKAFLENGVSQIGGGRFIQVSGLRFQYDIAQAVGSRVSAAWRFDGVTQGPPIDLTTSSTYTIATNDFMVAGGDGYPNVAVRAATRDPMLDDVIDYIGANSPVSPAIQDRHLGDVATAP